MQIKIKDIFKFYEIRLSCHVRSVNYFASLLGYSFPEHDGNKTNEPTRTVYAYIVYNEYHPELHLMDEYFELCENAKRDHHKHSQHHIQYYKNVCEIPDVRLYEMISDWASANFEQKNILNDVNAVTMEQWFDNNLAKLPWTQHQIELIKQSFDIIKARTDDTAIKSIWMDLLDLI